MRILLGRSLRTRWWPFLPASGFQSSLRRGLVWYGMGMAWYCQEGGHTLERTLENCTYSSGAGVAVVNALAYLILPTDLKSSAE